MYSYIFEFYKPEKKIYTPQEITGTINNLRRVGFEVQSLSTISPSKITKEGRVNLLGQEHYMLELRKHGQLLDLDFGPAEEKYHGKIGSISMPEEQFKEDPERNARLMEEAALAIFEGLRPLFAWGDHELELGRLAPWLRFDRVNALAWENLFSKELVEQLGGLKNVLLFPEDEKEYRGKEWSYVTMLLSPEPTQPIRGEIASECHIRFPGAILRSFEIISTKAIERAD